MKLTIIDRLTLLNNFFKMENTKLLKLTLAKEIIEKVSITSKELIAVDFDKETNILNPEKNEKQARNFNFSKEQKELIATRILELDEDDKSSMQILNIHNKLK